MKKKLFPIILFIVLVFVIAVAWQLYDQLAAEAYRQDIVVTDQKATVEQTAEGEDSSETQLSPAPDFTVYDAEGNEVHLSDYLGKPVVVNFWASWCGPCKGEMPDFYKKYQECGEEVQFMMINCTDGSKETVDTAREFVEEQGYLFPVFYDTDQGASYTYGVSAIPSTFFVDAEGMAVAWAQGAISGDLLQKGIDMIK